MEQVITADHIRSLKNLGMDEFEQEIWDSLGQCYARADRVKLLEGEGKTNEYHCHVQENGTYRFKGPYFERTRSHLQRVLGDDNVLSVKFETEGKSPLDSGYVGFKKVAKEGILVGLRRYRFFVCISECILGMHVHDMPCCRSRGIIICQLKCISCSCLNEEC